jgi:hypothetical protein
VSLSDVTTDELRRNFPEHVNAKTYTEWVAYFLVHHKVSVENARRYAQACVDTFGVPGDEQVNEFGEVCP